MRAGVHLAQEVGRHLGRRTLLFGALSQTQADGAFDRSQFDALAILKDVDIAGSLEVGCHVADGRHHLAPIAVLANDAARNFRRADRFIRPALAAEVHDGGGEFTVSI